MLADTAYGGDENHSRCLAEGIDLITPTPGKCPADQVDSERLTVADFTVEPGVKIGPWGREIPDPKCVASPGGVHTRFARFTTTETKRSRFFNFTRFATRARSETGDPRVTRVGGRS